MLFHGHPLPLLAPLVPGLPVDFYSGGGSFYVEAAWRALLCLPADRLTKACFYARKTGPDAQEHGFAAKIRGPDGNLQLPKKHDRINFSFIFAGTDNVSEA